MQYIYKSKIEKEHNSIGKIMGLSLFLLVINLWIIGWKAIILYFFETISLVGGYMVNEISKEMIRKDKLPFKMKAVYLSSIIIFIVNVIINLFMII